MQDRYLKSVLTVIALALLWSAARPSAPAPAYAEHPEPDIAGLIEMHAAQGIGALPLNRFQSDGSQFSYFLVRKQNLLQLVVVQTPIRRGQPTTPEPSIAVRGTLVL